MYDDDTEEIESDNYDDPNYDEEIERQDQSRFQESESRILDFDDLQNELEEIKKDANSVTFNNVVHIRNITQNSQTGSDIVEENLAFDDYDRNKGTPIENLNINLGSDDIPRFSCGCHKLNLAIRKAIKAHKPLVNILSKLNKANAHFRRVCKLSKIFRNKKCRLRLENLTRWSSSYLLLESVKRAYDKNAFSKDDPEKQCPIELDEIELYLQILKPAYIFSISMQKNNSTIADTLPGTLPG